MATKSFVEFIEKGGIRKYFKDTRFNPVSKSSSMTQDVGLGDDGKFYTNPGFNIHGLATQNTLDDADEMAFHDTSASAQRKTTWSNIKSKLKSYFDTIYLSGASLVGYATQAWVQSQGYGTYTKPSGGIPKTDLASSVQTSLNHADNAVRYDNQSLTDTQKAQARTNIGAYAKPSGGIPKTDLSLDVQNKLDEAITSVNGKTGTSVVLGAEDIDVEREAAYGGTTDLETAINGLYSEVRSKILLISWVEFTWDVDLNEWVSDTTWAQIQSDLLNGYTIQGRLYNGVVTPTILEYAGIVIRGGFERHVFYAPVGTNMVMVEMSYDDPDVNEVEVFTRSYYQDLTPYRTAADQDIIDNGKQPLINDLEIIRSGAISGATALQDAPNNFKQYLRQNGAWVEVLTGVSMVNGQTGVVALDADDIQSTKTPTILHFVVDGGFIELLIGVRRNSTSGPNCTPGEVSDALQSGFGVTIDVHDQDVGSGVVFSAQPVKYEIKNGKVYLYILADHGHDYNHSLFIVDGSLSGQGWNMTEYQYETTHSFYDNANYLPYASRFTVEQYLESLEARIAALENS